MVFVSRRLFILKKKSSSWSCCVDEGERERQADVSSMCGCESILDMCSDLPEEVLLKFKLREMPERDDFPVSLKPFENECKKYNRNGSIYSFLWL